MIRFMREADFERLYDEHAQGLFGFLVYRCGDRALAEDILAETFERAYRAHTRFERRRASERTWLYTIALNRLRDHGRRRGAEGRAIARVAAEMAGGHPDAAFAGVDQHDELVRCLRLLSDEEREAVTLRFAGALSLKEIA
jgi:RNA polymerase sigma-70 factor, ECF subfamily